MIELERISSLADLLRAQARENGDLAALTFEGHTQNYAELDARANRIANRLLAAGVEPGARIAWLAKNTDTFFETMFGAIKARAVICPVNFRLAAPEIGVTVADSGAKLMFVGPDFVELAKQALAPLAVPPQMTALDDFEDWLGATPEIDPHLANLDDDDILQLYTSGTTGLPKGVVHTNATYMSLLRIASEVDGFGYKSGETTLNAMPQFHVAGVNIGVIAAANAARVVVVKELMPALLLDTIVREKVQHAFLVPAVIQMLLMTPEIAKADFSSLKMLAYGASPISEAVLTQARQVFGCPFTQLYGMTETGGGATYLPDDAHEGKRLRSCGKAWPGIDVKIVDANGAEVPVGDVGELIMRAPLLMKGYWNKPEATLEALRDGWMHTGDAAYRDEEGYFYIYDRLKDMIVTGAENVYPAEVENAIMGHPSVQDVAVIGVPDAQWGEAVRALVVAKPDAPRDSDSIIAWARERIAGYKTPKAVDFIDAIPRNPSGKILRRQLREPFWVGHERRVG
jgi:acyl-CoA synthetase (AMP-forming)/AMP-acid ligase II